MSYILDASSIIHAWDTYPADAAHFNSFWKSFAVKLQEQQFVIPAIVFNEEVRHKSPDCHRKLKPYSTIIPSDSQILTTAREIKNLLDIEEERYGDGVGENDLIIIASAKIHRRTLVTEEKIQNNLPSEKKNYKIPAVCDMAMVSVAHIKIIDLINTNIL